MLLSFNQSLLLLLNNSDSTLTLYVSWANFWIMKYFQVCFCMFNRYELGFPTYQILTQSYSNKRPIYIFSSLRHQNSNNLVTCLFTASLTWGKTQGWSLNLRGPKDWHTQSTNLYLLLSSSNEKVYHFNHLGEIFSLLKNPLLVYSNIQHYKQTARQNGAASASI